MISKNIIYILLIILLVFIYKNQNKFKVFFLQMFFYLLDKTDDLLVFLKLKKKTIIKT